MFTPTSFADLPAQSIRFYGGLFEKQLRLMTAMTQAMMRPNPFLVAMTEMQWAENALSVPTTSGPLPAAPAAKGKAKSKPRGRRKPATPPAMPENDSVPV